MTDVQTISQFIALHRERKTADGQRLGQRFFNNYCKHDPNGKGWPELFYADDSVAEQMIRQYLTRHQYEGEGGELLMPQHLRRV